MPTSDLTPSPQPLNWSRWQRKLHWATVVLVVLALGSALTMMSLSNEHRLLKFVLYQMHKSMGIIVFVLTIIRLVMRYRLGRPALPDTLNLRLISIGHGTLYGLLLLTPILGYLTNSTSPSRIPILFLMVLPLPNLTGPSKEWSEILGQGHTVAALILLTIAMAHGLFALKHHREGSDILLRLWRG